MWQDVQGGNQAQEVKNSEQQNYAHDYPEHITQH